LALLLSSGDCHFTDRFFIILFFKISGNGWDWTWDLLNTRLVRLPPDHQRSPLLAAVIMLFIWPTPNRCSQMEQVWLVDDMFCCPDENQLLQFPGDPGFFSVDEFCFIPLHLMVLVLGVFCCFGLWCSFHFYVVFMFTDSCLRDAVYAALKSTFEKMDIHKSL